MNRNIRADFSDWVGHQSYATLRLKNDELVEIKFDTLRYYEWLALLGLHETLKINQVVAEMDFDNIVTSIEFDDYWTESKTSRKV